MSKIDYNELVEFVRTHDEYYVAEFMFADNKRIAELEQDRDTWKRACELACEREDDCYVYDNIHRAYEFYQQAKKEGEQK